MSVEIDNMQDILDVRDIIERFEELESELEDVKSGGDEITAAFSLPEWFKAIDFSAHPFADSIEEYQRLASLLDELRGNGGDEQWRGDWYPVTLIRDSHFNDAMDELLEDIGVLPKDLPCYLSITVDYNALQMDYSSIEIDGVDYWYR